jgi:hypothetical protein
MAPGCRGFGPLPMIWLLGGVWWLVAGFIAYPAEFLPWLWPVFWAWFVGFPIFCAWVSWGAWRERQERERHRKEQ